VKDNITKQPGFISGQFHKSIKPESRYNFINVALWENEDVYWKAYEKSAAPMNSVATAILSVLLEVGMIGWQERARPVARDFRCCIGGASFDDAKKNRRVARKPARSTTVSLGSDRRNRRLLETGV